MILSQIKNMINQVIEAIGLDKTSNIWDSIARVARFEFVANEQRHCNLQGEGRHYGGKGKAYQATLSPPQGHRR